MVISKTLMVSKKKFNTWGTKRGKATNLIPILKDGGTMPISTMPVYPIGNYCKTHLSTKGSQSWKIL